MSEPPDTSGYFRARIISGNRITIDNHIMEIYDLQEGDLCRFRLCAVISRKHDVKQEDG